MSFQLGRIIFANEPLTWDNSGLHVRIAGTFAGASVAAALVVRDQLLGYVNNYDEPVIPVVSAAEPRMNGYYRVASVDIPTDPMALLNGLFAYTVELDPIVGYAGPTIESIVKCALMANSFAVPVTTAQFTHAVPNGADVYAWPNSSSAGAPNLQLNEVGGLLQRYSTGAAAPSDVIAWSIDPPHFYDAAVKIEDLASPASTVVGMQHIPTLANFRINNGVIRISFAGSTNSLKLEYWNGAWRAGYAFQVYSIGESSPLGIGSPAVQPIKILRNAAEECIVRLGLNTAGGAQYGPAYLDIRLRRGARLGSCYMSYGGTYTPGGGTVLTDQWRFQFAVAAASTALTAGGLRTTAADGDGLYYILTTSQTPTKDLTNGRLLTAAAIKKADFGVGITDTLVTNTMLPQDVEYQYLGLLAERMRVVSR